MTTDVDESHTSSLLFYLILFILFVKLRHNYIVFSLPVCPPIPPIYHPLTLSQIKASFSLIVDMYI